MALGIGILGCGNISAAYMRLGPVFDEIEVRACADINTEAAAARAEEFGLRALSVEDLLAADDIDVVVNLTIPAAHYETSKAILEAGKHVYSEKPFVLSADESRALCDLAEAKGLRIGSAPDTFMGGAHQLARKLIDDGALGRIVGGTAHVMNHGMEHWHPNPDFFFQPGAGPMLDLGPYYVTNLIQLVGPVKRVMAMTASPHPTRTILSEPRKGEQIPVNTPTTVTALLEFENGAIVQMGTSWDVWSHGHHNMELYGEEGSLFVPDPNFFGGEVRLTAKDQPAELPDWDHPLARPNQDTRANYRGIGLADMARAIGERRPHRCDHRIAGHAVEVMTKILESGAAGEPRQMATTCPRPEPFGPEEAQSFLKG
jgi:predicted dehydrogenase